ncbi:hypothetical protein Tco_0902893 [Tanacetum coccineum]
MWWHLYGGDGGRRNEAFLHMLCLGLYTQPTPREVDRWESWFKGCGSNDELGKVEKVKALGANGVMSGSRLRVVWMEVGGGIMKARVVSRVMLGFILVILKGWEAFVREWDPESSCLRDHFPFLGEELEKRSSHDPRDRVHLRRCTDDWNERVQRVGEKHSVGKCHIGAFVHTHHSVGNVVGEVEGFFSGEAVEHVTKASVWMVLVSGETNGIFT